MSQASVRARSLATDSTRCDNVRLKRSILAFWSAPDLSLRPRPRLRGFTREDTEVGDLQAELLTDFFEGSARGACANVHL
jgi:hypothetical protein